MAGDVRQQVLDALAAEGPELTVAVLARRLAMLPSRLVPVLDDLSESGLVTAGAGRGTVALVPPADPPSPAP